MFCDEPTSGLDSYMAQNIIEVWNCPLFKIDFEYNTILILHLGS